MNTVKNTLAAMVIIITVIVGVTVVTTVRYHLNTAHAALTEIVNR